MGFTEGDITKSKENLFWIRFKRFRRRFTQVKKGRWCCLSVECVICTFFHHYILYLLGVAWAKSTARCMNYEKE